MNNFKIYKSSAGSGKTFTLVREYLAIALKAPERYKHILALTFTNKAAGEMKERILSELGLLASGAPGAMRDILAEATGLSPTQLTEAARDVRARILHDYANFAVRTIDSFTHKLIRSFAKDLELPGRFDIEMDTKLILQRTVDQLMDSIGRDEYVTEILVRFVEEKLRDRSGWRIEADLKEVGQELFKETSKPHLAAIKEFDHTLFPEFIAMLRTQKRAFPDQLQALARLAVDVMRAHSLTARDFSGGQYSVGYRLEQLCAAMKPADIHLHVMSKVFREAAEEDRWLKKGERHPRVEAALDAGLRDHVTAIWEHFQSEYDTFLTAWHAFQNVHSLAVMQQIEDLIEQYKEQYNLVHISDFQPKIEQFMREEAPEYIYWRLGERYQHYMLDEFQDTSLLQWLNLRPLVDHLRAGGAGTLGSLLIVGDSKQAIYRWRGGETSLMETVVPIDLGVTPLVLGRNFRSAEYVVEFNNQFFAHAVDMLAASEPEIAMIYADMAQEVRPGNEGRGMVRVELLQQEGVPFAELAFGRTVELVQSLIEQGYQYRDIAILVRAKTEGSEVAEVLAQAGIKVISAESILLSRSPIVNFMVSLLKFIADPSDAIARAEVLHYFFLHLHRETSLDIDPHHKIRELLMDEHPVTAMLETLPAEFKRLYYRTDRLSLYELLEEVVRIFGLASVAPAFVQHFLDVVLEYSERKKPDIAAFIEYWEEKKGGFSLIVPSGENAVEIMTIHKSKGLEFPVVIIPKADWSTTPKAGGTMWADSGDLFGAYPNAHLVKPQAGIEESAFGETYGEEVRKTLLDNLNLLYVAFTRPRERLYVLAPGRKPSTSRNPAPEELKNVGALIRRVLEADAFKAVDSTLYESGFAFPPAPRPPLTPTPRPPLISTTWRDRIRIDRKFRKYWEQPEGGDAYTDGPLLAQLFRNLLHAGNLELEVARLVETGMLPAQESTRIQQQASRILAQPAVAALYATGRAARLGMTFLSATESPLVVDRVLPQTGGSVLLMVLDTTRDQLDRRALRSCLEFLDAHEGGAHRAFVLNLPEGRLAEFAAKG